VTFTNADWMKRRPATLVTIAFLVIACTPAPPTPIPSEAAASPVASPRLQPTSAAATPPVSPTAAADLPDPGGTCTSTQFVLGTATAAYPFGHLYDRSVDFMQPVRNDGPACVLALPKIIGVASSASAFQAVSAVNAGVQTCAKTVCKQAYPTSFAIAAGQSFALDLAAGWCDPDCLARSGRSPAPCSAQIRDVARAEWPLAEGAVEINLSVVVYEVCASPATIAVWVQTLPMASRCDVTFAHADRDSMAND
jgi:hypothetical protein